MQQMLLKHPHHSLKLQTMNQDLMTGCHYGSHYKSFICSANEENESILKINAFLEGAVKEGKISERLYGHLKGTSYMFVLLITRMKYCRGTA